MVAHVRDFVAHPAPSHSAEEDRALLLALQHHFTEPHELHGIVVTVGRLRFRVDKVKVVDGRPSLEASITQLSK